MTPTEARAKRIAVLKEAHGLIENELRLLGAPPKQRRSRMKPLACGTEQMYQRHAHFGDTSKDGRRVTCEPCLKAHAEHEREASARRRSAAS